MKFGRDTEIGCLSGFSGGAKAAEVKKLLLTHHDPNHDDAVIDEMVKNAQTQVAKLGGQLEVIGAREGDEFVL